MGLHSSKKHFGIAAFAVIGCHTLQGSWWVSLPIPASSMGRSSKHCATTCKCGKEGLPALLMTESLLPEEPSSPAKTPSQPLGPFALLGLLASPQGHQAKSPPGSLNGKG